MTNAATSISPSRSNSSETTPDTSQSGSAPSRSLALETATTSERANVLVLGSGRTVSAAMHGTDDALVIRARSGKVELSIRMTDQGPVLVFESAAVEIHSPGDVSVTCDALSVSTRRGIKMETSGDWETSIGGNERVSVTGASEHRAKELDITSTEGEIRVNGAGDAWITAPMVLLNCDREEEMKDRAWKAAGERVELEKAKREKKHARIRERSEEGIGEASNANTEESASENAERDR